jgi:tetratricopeptide (TPR) repeat protein
VSDIQSLEAEVELTHGNKDHAIELLALADKAKRSAMTVEGLAHAYEASGNPDQAAVWYELFLEEVDPPIGWEPQQGWLAAHYHLARIYLAKGDKAKAATQLDRLLDPWKDADPGLPLLKDARNLKQEIDSKP